MSASVVTAVLRGDNRTVGVLGQGWCRVVSGLALGLALVGGFALAHRFAWQLCRTAWFPSRWLGPSSRFWPSPGPSGATLPPPCHLQLSQFCFWSRAGARPRGAREGRFCKDPSGLAWCDLAVASWMSARAAGAPGLSPAAIGDTH